MSPIDPTNSNSEKPKLIIDEDWKTQVEREREQLRQHSEPTPAGGNETKAELDEDAPRTRDSKEIPPPPPATFPFLVSMLGTQALAAMGYMGNDPDAPPPRLDYAKHYIDLLGVLEDKTKSNLSTEESSLLTDWLHQLRMGYVERVRQGG